jgi:preprotein translocase subunit SecY
LDSLVCLQVVLLAVLQSSHLGIMPYISASIIIQLLGLAVPSITKMQREGESGRKKINQYTRFLTIAIGVGSGSRLHQAQPSCLVLILPNSSLGSSGAVLILMCSTLFVMWLGEKIAR